MFCLYQVKSTFCLYQVKSTFCLYQGVVYPYSHQRPWGGERLGGRYTPVERLRRRLRGCRREGRRLGDDTCCGRLVSPISNTVDGWARRSKAAASGRAASITTRVSRRWARGSSGNTTPGLSLVASPASRVGLVIDCLEGSPEKGLVQTQVDTLNSLVNTLSESLFARMDALQASLAPSIPQPSSRPSHRPDAGSPQPGVTAGESRMFQALGETSRKNDVNVRLDQGGRTPRQEYASPSAASQPRAAPGAAPQPSATFVPPQPPVHHEVPPQPSTSGWVPSGPQPPRSRGSWSSSKSEDSETESEYAARESSSPRLAELIYDVCPH